ncbi:MAG: hypothetical protein H6Q07_2279, partial [Acidobacteria bacterium]|nr:hypothetical protein [Acidobacteriota bacterium]
RRHAGDNRPPRKVAGANLQRLIKTKEWEAKEAAKADSDYG